MPGFDDRGQEEQEIEMLTNEITHVGQDGAERTADLDPAVF